MSYVASRRRWVAQLTLPDRTRKTVGYAATEPAARRLLEKAKRQERELATDRTTMTVATYLSAWLEEQRRQVAPSWWVRCESLCRVHLIPALGRWRLSELGPEHLAGLYREKGTTLAPQTVHHLHAVLHRALVQAVRWGYVGRNVADLVDAPRLPRREPRMLTEGETGRLLAALAGDPLRPLWLLLLATGMREGEALGLRWGDVDLDAGAVAVRRNVQRVWRQGMVEGDTKGHRPRRVLVPAVAVAALRDWRAARADAAPDALVFPNTAGTPWEVSNLRRRHWLPLLERAGIPALKVHELRHAAASLLLRLGVHPAVVAEMLGHADPGVTLRVYSHVLPTLQAEAADDYGRLLERLAHAEANSPAESPPVVPDGESVPAHAPTTVS